MSEYTDSIKQAAEGLDQAEKRLEVAKAQLDKVRGHCGQNGYSVVVNGVTVAVSVCDSKSYQGTLIRGREMIHLGALKALGAVVHMEEENVKKCKDHLAKCLADLYVSIGGTP